MRPDGCLVWRVCFQDPAGECARRPEGTYRKGGTVSRRSEPAVPRTRVGCTRVGRPLGRTRGRPRVGKRRSLSRAGRVRPVSARRTGARADPATTTCSRWTTSWSAYGRTARRTPADCASCPPFDWLAHSLYTEADLHAQGPRGRPLRADVGPPEAAADDPAAAGQTRDRAERHPRPALRSPASRAAARRCCTTPSRSTPASTRRHLRNCTTPWAAPPPCGRRRAALDRAAHLVRGPVRATAGRGSGLLDGADPARRLPPAPWQRVPRHDRRRSPGGCPGLRRLAGVGGTPREAYAFHRAQLPGRHLADPGLQARAARLLPGPPPGTAAAGLTRTPRWSRCTATRRTPSPRARASRPPCAAGRPGRCGPVGAEWADRVERHLVAAERARLDVPRGRLLDLNFADLVADPAGQVRAVLAFAGATATPMFDRVVSTFVDSTGPRGAPRPFFQPCRIRPSPAGSDQPVAWYRGAMGCEEPEGQPREETREADPRKRVPFGDREIDQATPPPLREPDPPRGHTPPQEPASPQPAAWRLALTVGVVALVGCSSASTRRHLGSPAVPQGTLHDVLQEGAVISSLLLGAAGAAAGPPAGR